MITFCAALAVIAIAFTNKGEAREIDLSVFVATGVLDVIMVFLYLVLR